MAFGKKKEEQKAPKVVVAAPTTDVEKFKRLFAISEQIDKKFDTTNSIIRLGEKNIVTLPSIPTLLPTFDYDVMGIGGIPRGRIIEIFGPESAGKTTFTLWLIAQLQKLKGLAAFVDAEHALDPGYASKLGVDVDKLLISQPDHGDQALYITNELIKSRAVELVVVDSVAALTPEAELAGDIGDNHVGLQARMMAQALRIMTAEAAKNLVTVVFINQIREKIGVMYGNPETTPGGRALKHYSSVRIDVRRKEEIKENNVLVGHSIRLKAVKNKVGTPLRETVVDLYYPETRFPTGFDTIGDLITYASGLDLFTLSGSWYSYEGTQIAQGLEKLKKAVRDSEEILGKVRKQVAERATKKVTV